MLRHRAASHDGQSERASSAQSEGPKATPILCSPLPPLRALDPLGPSTRQGNGEGKRFSHLSLVLHLPSHFRVSDTRIFKILRKSFPEPPTASSPTLDSQPCLVFTDNISQLHWARAPFSRRDPCAEGGHRRIDVGWCKTRV